MFGDHEPRLGRIEHLPLLNARDHRGRQPGEAMAARLRFVALDDVGLCDRLQRVAGVSGLPAARLARLAAQAAGDARRLLQAVARRRLAAVRAVLVQLTPEVRHFLAQRRVLNPQNLNLALQRANQVANSGRRIIHTLTHASLLRVTKNRASSGTFSKTVANRTHPSLGVTSDLTAASLISGSRGNLIVHGAQGRAEAGRLVEISGRKAPAQDPEPVSSL